VDKDTIQKTQEKYPFLTGITYGGNEYVGIVVNQDNDMLTFYDLALMPNNNVIKTFLEYGEIWWWESNRQIPIDIFLNYEMRIFQPYIKSFIIKDTEINFGPVTSLQNLIKKRIKRRGYQLVRKED